VTAERDSRSEHDDLPDDVQTDEERVETEPRDRISTVSPRRRRLTWRSTLLMLTVIAAAVSASWVFFVQYRPQQQTGDTAGHDAVLAASDGAVAVLSYSSETLEQDFARANKHLTGEFLSYYDRFTRQIVTPAAQRGHIRTTAKVVRAAASEVRPNSAVVLTFINQVTMSRDRPEPALNMSAVRVGLTKVNGAWLISSFDPV
jgi:Mce-associated membrane protein